MRRKRRRRGGGGGGGGRERGGGGGGRGRGGEGYYSDDSPSLGMCLSSGMGLTYLIEAWNRVLNVINHCPLHGSHK